VGPARYREDVSDLEDARRGGSLAVSAVESVRAPSFP